MTLDDFQPALVGGKLLPGHWRGKSPIVTAIGDVGIELRTGTPGEPPDELMLQEAAALVAYVASREADVFALIHEEYLFACESPEHLASIGVPQGLSAYELGPFIRPALFVTKTSRGFVSGMTVSPEWDPEHGLDYMYKGDVFEKVEY